MLYNAIKNQKWAILWSVFILIVCNIQFSDTIGTGFFFEGFDKLAHAGFFFVLSVLLFYGKSASQHDYSFRLLTIIKVFLICVSIGGLIELLQLTLFTYRGAEWWDFYCDIIGTCMGVFSYVILHTPYYKRLK